MDYFLVSASPEILALMAIGLVITLKSGHQYISDKLKYDKFSEPKLGEGFAPGEQRIVNALKINKKASSFDLQQNQHDSNELKNFVSDINASLVHYSGNCALLSTVVMYNFLNSYHVSLAVKNTYPIMEGISEDDASNFLLGQDLESYGKLESIDDLENKILECYGKTGENVFLISATGYKVPFVGETGHDFNAVVLLDKNQKPTVQFVDAWKTSDYLPSKQHLKEKYAGKSPSYEILCCPNKKLIKDFSSVISKPKNELKERYQTLRDIGSPDVDDIKKQEGHGAKYK